MIDRTLRSSAFALQSRPLHGRGRRCVRRTVVARGASFHQRSLVLALVGALVAPLLVGGTAFAATFVVNVGQNGTTFVDQASGTNTTTIHVGDTVQWNWGGSPHSATSGTCQPGGGYYGGGGCTADGVWDSGVHSAPYSFSRTFDQAGNFPYYCAIHGYMMLGVVFVEQPAGNPPSASFRFGPTGPVVGTSVRFTDTSTGSATAWAWDFGDGHSAVVQNPSHAFEAPGTYTVTLSATNTSGSNSNSKTVTVAAGGQVPCVVDGATLCLSNGRFRVTARWEKPDGTSGAGNGVTLTSDSGYFWFFDPSNIEMVTKVLNACSINGNYWVFGAGLTNVKVTLDVLDTSNGVSEQYVNPLNTAFQPIQDTAAFGTCP
jgi:PKD repeat protein